MYAFIFFVLILYVIVLGLLYFGYDKVEEFSLVETSKKEKFSIIIPFRDEAQQLPFLLKSLSTLDYPAAYFEVIMVNDDSQDMSVSVISEYKKSSNLTITIIDNERHSNSPKKDAIETAIKIANHNWIVTTDADCQVPLYWLESINEFIQRSNSNYEFIIAPLTINDTSTLLDRFQALEILTLQAITIGSYGLKKPLLCNGANLIYKKSLFEKLNGYQGNNTIASGDDMFLLEKVKDYDRTKIGLLKTPKAAVTTKAEPNLNSLLSQKKRWVKKMGVKTNLLSALLGIVILLMNFVFITLLVFSVIDNSYAKTLLQITAVKFGIDFLLLFKTARFFKQEKLLFSFWWISFLYPFYLFVVLFTSYLGPYRWKGRKFSA